MRPEDIHEVDDLIKKRNPSFGGVSGLITGLPGCGKTNAQARIALIDVKKDVLVVWRSKSTCQWSVFLGKAKILFWLKAGLKYQLYDRANEKETKLEKYAQVKRYKTPEDLVAGLQPGVINVVHTTPFDAKSNQQQIRFIKEWIAILDALTRRKTKREVTLLFDEVEDLVPQMKAGFTNVCQSVTDILKELRKNKVHIFAATHHASELFWKTKNKFGWRIHMRGSVIKKPSMIYPHKTLTLLPGHAVVESRYFEEFKFRFVGHDKELRATITDPTMKQLTNPILRDWDNGLSVEQLAKKHHRTVQHIHRILKQVE